MKPIKSGRALVLASCIAVLVACSPSSKETSSQGETAQSASDRLAARGKSLYEAQCQACHQANGQGLPGAFPPLAGSDYIQDDPARAIGVAVFGLAGPITVNGVAYSGVMPGFGHLSDGDLAALLSYVFTSWGNSIGAVSEEQVAAARAVRSR